MAFAFVALLGMIPSGLGIFHQAMDTSVSAHIAQRITGELQETDYYTLLENCQPNLTIFTDADSQSGLMPRQYFDDQGNQVEVENPAQPTEQERVRILYEAIIRVSRARIVPLSSAGSVSRLGSSNLTTLTIQIVNNPAGREIALTGELLVDPTVSRLTYHSYSTLIARNTPWPDTK